MLRRAHWFGQDKKGDLADRQHVLHRRYPSAEAFEIVWFERLRELTEDYEVQTVERM